MKIEGYEGEWKVKCVALDIKDEPHSVTLVRKPEKSKLDLAIEKIKGCGISEEELYATKLGYKEGFMHAVEVLKTFPRYRGLGEIDIIVFMKKYCGDTEK